MPRTNTETIALLLTKNNIEQHQQAIANPTPIESCIIMMATTLAAYLDAHEELHHAPLWDDSSARAGFVSLVSGFEHLTSVHEVGRLNPKALSECVKHLERYGKPRGL